ncbi:hypothetical protein PR048_010822, partial [Dryococelus australis]
MQSNETTICNISKNSAIAKVLEQCKLIVWNEYTMAHKKSLEALDRTMQDLRNNQNRFGGAMILLGDFRQTLPASVLWKHVKILNLSKNMRVELQNYRSGKIFSKQLIDIGNGKIPSDVLSGCITFPDNFCQFTESTTKLIQKVTYKSVDSATNQDDVNYQAEFFNSLDLPGLPPHNLQLKYKGEDVFIPRIPMIPTDIPFEFKRLQFPVRLAFAMTINKSQVQSLSVCDIKLENPCFSHGQLYVACSRVGKPSALFVYAS